QAQGVVADWAPRAPLPVDDPGGAAGDEDVVATEVAVALLERQPWGGENALRRGDVGGRERRERDADAPLQAADARKRARCRARPLREPELDEARDRGHHRVDGVGAADALRA